MFEKLGQFSGLLKQVGTMKAQMQQMQEALEQAQFTAEAGGGAVEATVNGKGEIKAVTLSADPVSAGDREMLEDLIVAAVAAAQAKAAQAAQERMTEITGGIDLGGLQGLLGQ